MMRKLGAFLPLIALVCLVALGAFMLLRGGERETISEGLVGQRAPTFALMRLDGEGMVTSDEFAGRPHLINLFASWCTPCRAEHPQLMALEDDGVSIIGVAYKDRPEATRGFLHELGDPFAAVAQDPDGRFGLELGVVGVPETFVIGADGRVRAVHRGPLTPDVVRDEILPALAN
jgi:cytochrome c biogenesis protein CcmG/thiol:disulfide interchange protein DsbE